MSDIVYFLCLGVAGLSAIAAVAATSAIIGGSDSPRAAVGLVVASLLGFVCTLPFGGTQEAPWLPLLAGVFFAAAVLATVLSVLCDIRGRARQIQHRLARPARGAARADEPGSESAGA